MSSGALPLATYHRAQALGEGTYGSVVVVYNDEGEEFALKLFLDDDEEEEEDEADIMDLGALREISILRLLRLDNGHPNIVPLFDVKSAETDDGEDLGAGTAGCMAIAMPFYKDGTLGDAIDKGLLKSKKVKVDIAHGFLSAVAYLHDNGIMHRDIKCDNVMLEMSSDGCYRPILIDFSLAKLTNGVMYGSGASPFRCSETEMTHTGGQGTPTYMAPEVVASKPYNQASDLWSVGVILLELLQNHTLNAAKNKEAEKLVEEAKQSLPDQPFANLVRGLLTVDPDLRLSAREALASPLFLKFGLEIPPVRLIDIHAALPFDGENDDSNENEKPNGAAIGKSQKKDPVILKRQKLVSKICNELDCIHPLTRYAAMVYCQQMYQIDDTLDDISTSQVLFDCVVLASKFFETELPDLGELDERQVGAFKNWSLEEYRDNEQTIWLLLDHCLYPRGMKDWMA